MAVLALGAVSMNIGAALVSDLVPPERLRSGMSVFQHMHSLGTMAGFAISGNLLAHLSVQTTFLVWSVFPAAAVVLAALIRTGASASPATPSAGRS